MSKILKEAERLVSTDRKKEYGDVKESFRRIANFWSDYLDKEIDEYDVAKMMILLKLSRSKKSNKEDNYVDIIGYVLCVEELLKENEINNYETKIAKDPF